MSRKTFQRLNEERAAKEEPLLANPRNAAAGSLRQLDPKIAAQRRLDCVIFNIQLTDGEPFQTDAQQLDYLEKLRFRVIPRAVLSDPAQVQAEIDRLKEYRKTHTEAEFEQELQKSRGGLYYVEVKEALKQDE